MAQLFFQAQPQDPDTPIAPNPLTGVAPHVYTEEELGIIARWTPKLTMFERPYGWEEGISRDEAVLRHGRRMEQYEREEAEKQRLAGMSPQQVMKEQSQQQKAASRDAYQSYVVKCQERNQRIRNATAAWQEAQVHRRQAASEADFLMQQTINEAKRVRDATIADADLRLVQARAAMDAAKAEPAPQREA